MRPTDRDARDPFGVDTGVDFQRAAPPRTTMVHPRRRRVLRIFREDHHDARRRNGVAAVRDFGSVSVAWSVVVGCPRHRSIVGAMIPASPRMRAAHPMPCRNNQPLWKGPWHRRVMILGRPVLHLGVLEEVVDSRMVHRRFAVGAVRRCPEEEWPIALGRRTVRVRFACIRSKCLIVRHRIPHRKIESHPSRYFHRPSPQRSLRYRPI